MESVASAFDDFTLGALKPLPQLKSKPTAFHFYVGGLIASHLFDILRHHYFPFPDRAITKIAPTNNSIIVAILNPGIHK
jgi:hypothetical protein